MRIFGGDERDSNMQDTLVLEERFGWIPGAFRPGTGRVSAGFGMVPASLHYAVTS
jgi:hypothetical protein